MTDLRSQLNYPELVQDAQTVLETLVPAEREVGNSQGRWFLSRLLPYRTIEDRIAGVVLTFIDITERKRFENAIFEKSEQLRMAAEISGFGVWQYVVERNEFEFDQRAAKMWGLSQSPQSKDVFFGCIHPQDRTYAQSAFSEALDPQGPGEYTLQFRTTIQGTSDRWLVVNGVVKFEVDSGKRVPVALIGTALDITEIKSRENSLQAADRNKNQFLATLAHELRNPLAPILSGVQALQRSAPDADTNGSTLATMERQVNHMVRLIDDLLDLSRITQGKIHIRKTTCNLIELIQSTVNTASELFAASGLELRLHSSTEAVWTKGDEVRLTQIFTNLLGNACKYTERGGKVTVFVEADEGVAQVRVRDTGIGIPVDMLDYVFETFLQVSGSMTKANSGLGIGLSLVRALVELHGGTVTAHSQGPGYGSEFVVRLPIVHCQPPLAEAMPQALVDAPSRPLKILLADDNVAASQMLALILRMEGHQIELAFDGLEAETKAGEFLPDVIILDLGMPNRDGLESARQIRTHAWGEKMTLIALTGWGQSEMRERSRNAGFDFHLIKPVNRSELLKTLSQVTL